MDRIVVKLYHLNILGRKTSEVSENHLESVVLSEDFGSLPQFLRRYVKLLMKCQTLGPIINNSSEEAGVE